jgi:hypothetical protein
MKATAQKAGAKSAAVIVASPSRLAANSNT